MIDKFKEAFREEAYELLAQLEDTLLKLGDRPQDIELVNAAFRSIHTVKGSSSMFGYESIASFAHEVETVLDHCRNGKLAITRELVDLTLKARDYIRILLDVDESQQPAYAEEGEGYLRKYREYDSMVRGREKPFSPERVPEEAESVSEETRTYRVRFAPKRDIARNGTKVLNLVEELAALGEANVFPRVDAIPPLDELAAEDCYCSWDVLLTTDKDVNSIRDIFIFVEERCDLDIRSLGGLDAPGGEGAKPKRLGEILVERGEVSEDALRTALGSQRRLGEVLIENRIVTKPQIESALAEQEHLKKLHERGDLAAGSIRVSSEKLDGLVDLVGELVTLQARLSSTAFVLKDPSLDSIAELCERLIAQLRDNTMAIRMLPIGSTFNRFRRLVRDLSQGLGKDAELLTEGAETELDKTVIEKLGDPLVHIIRNSIDHGIEGPEARRAAGKPQTGSIKLSARHSGAYVLIDISDDGKGLDREAIRGRAVERGIIGAGQEYGDQELDQLIFEPGFSTAASVTSLSGRGVGMDVVKRQIESLSGSVHLVSESGRGMTVSLQIPLTLAIIEGLLVRIGGEFYVIPLSTVDGCIEIDRDRLGVLGRQRIISYRDELVPYIRLRELFESGGEEPPIQQLVIASAMDSRVGFVVDQVVGDYQTVIKPLGRMFNEVEGISGATILGDGTVALILDVNRIATSVRREGAHRAGGA